MSTLQYNGNEYNVIYIDANIGSSGDGLTPATALATIPSPLTDKTCYIVRRQEDNETTYVDLPQSWYDPLYYIMFLGMPTSDDPIYNILDESVRTAWGNDTGRYARIRCNQASYTSPNGNSYELSNTNNKTLFKSSTIRNFYASNCYFYRDGNGGSASSGANQLDFIFGFQGSARDGDITFNNCKFSYAQYNLENPDYIGMNSDVSTDTTKYPQYKCQAYIYITAVNSFTLNNCVINQVYSPASSTSYCNKAKGVGACIRASNMNKFIFTDSQYNILYRNSYDGSYYHEQDNGILLGDADDGPYISSYDTYIYPYNYTERCKAIVKNIEINRIYTENGARIIARCLAIYCGNIIADNIKIKHKVMHNGQLTGWTTNYAGYNNVELFGISSLNVSNLYTDLSNLNIASNRCFGIYGTLNTVGNPKVICKNIYIKMNPTGTFDMSGDNPCLDLRNSAQAYCANDNSIDQLTNSLNSSYGTFVMNPSKYFIYDNIIVEAQNTTHNAIYALRCGFKSPYINGKIYLGNATAEIKKHYNHISTSYGAEIHGSSYYKCDDFEANLSYPNYKGTNQVSWDPRLRSSVYIGKSNCIVANEIPATECYASSSCNSLICPNYIKTGQFFQRNEVCFCKSWNTVRTGSNAQGSLRFNNNYLNINNYSHPLIIGQDPYSGIQLAPRSIGKKILTAYIALKNMDESELGYTGRLGINVICPEKYTDYFNTEKENMFTHEYTSDSMGWQSDSSTWSGDTNLKSYKCEIPIEVFTLEEPIEVKIWFNWYSINGYVYVDPDFKVRDIV